MTILTQTHGSSSLLWGLTSQFALGLHCSHDKCLPSCICHCVLLKIHKIKTENCFLANMLIYFRECSITHNAGEQTNTALYKKSTVQGKLFLVLCLKQLLSRAAGWVVANHKQCSLNVPKDSVRPLPRVLWVCIIQFYSLTVHTFSAHTHPGCEMIRAADKHMHIP